MILHSCPSELNEIKMNSKPIFSFSIFDNFHGEGIVSQSYLNKDAIYGHLRLCVTNLTIKRNISVQKC